MRNCGDCGAKPGELHTPGCDMEKCPLCGHQAITDKCVYELSGIPTDFAEMEAQYPEIYGSGPTLEMSKRHDEECAKYGGPLPWEGEYHGAKEAREFGLFCYWGHPLTKELLPDSFVRGGRWFPCDANHPGARPDLNQLYDKAFWDKRSRRWVLKEAN